MHALPRPLAPPPEHSAEVVSFAELNRARSLRVLARADDAPQEQHPWAYSFPRPVPAPAARRRRGTT